MLIDINLYQLASTTKPTGWMEFQPVGFALPYSCSFCSGSAADRICGIVKGLCHAAGILRGHQILHHIADGSARRKFVFRDGERAYRKEQHISTAAPANMRKIFNRLRFLRWLVLCLRYEYLLLKNITAAIDNRSPANI